MRKVSRKLSGKHGHSEIKFFSSSLFFERKKEKCEQKKPVSVTVVVRGESAAANVS